MLLCRSEKIEGNNGRKEDNTAGTVRFSKPTLHCVTSAPSAKSFDKVWHKGLLYKLLTADFPLYMVQLVASYLHSRKFRAKVEAVLSSEWALSAGVPQGSLLLPLLFTLYVSDMPKTKKTSMTLYADDIAILASLWCPKMATSYLQEAILRLKSWFARWRIKVNPEKNEAVLFNRKRKDPQGYVVMFGRKIEWKNEAKYPEVILDKKLTWKQHVTSAVTKGETTAAAFQPLLCTSSKMSLSNKLFSVSPPFVRS